MSLVYISYRRNDASGHADRVYRRLRDWVGATEVYVDTGAGDLVQRWEETGRQQLHASRVVLALIGRRWVPTLLADPDDYVRRELQAALEDDKPVIPVLVDGADLPDADELPAPLQKLLTRHPARLDHHDPVVYEEDLRFLFEHIQLVLEMPATLVLRRLRRLSGASRSFDVMLDGRKIGSLSNNQRRAFSITPGTHALQIRTLIEGHPPRTSPELHFTIARGQQKRFLCHAAPWTDRHGRLHLRPDR